MEPLASQRFVTPSYHPRPRQSDLLRSIILHEPPHQTQPIPESKPNPQTQPFRLLDLPLELQRLIYTHHFNHWSVTLDYERLSMLRSKFHIKGVPSTNLLQTCRSVHRQAHPIRLAQFTGKLTLNSVFILIPLRKKPEFEWLKRNVRVLHFSDSSVHPERWSRYYTGFERLESLEIDFAAVVALDEECGQIERVLRGEKDAFLTGMLEYFRVAVVGELGDGVGVVVSQRFRMKNHLVDVGWKGVLFVKVRLDASHVEVIERVHDEDVDFMSKREFGRCRES